jgi:PAS domain-containing protein
MLLIKKGYFSFAIITSCALVLLLGITGYSAVKGRGAYTTTQLKFYSENCIYISILAIIVILTIFFLISRKSLKVLRELDKIAEISRYGKYYTGDHLKKLGTLGEKIDHLFFELNRLNEMKSLRISTLSNIQQFFLESIHLKLLITDMQGTIQYASRALLHIFEQESAQIIGKNISSLVQEIQFSELVADMELNRRPVMQENLTVKVGENSFTSGMEYIPIFNVKNQLSEIICISEKETILAELSKRAEQIVRITRARKKITDFFKKKGN